MTRGRLEVDDTTGTRSIPIDKNPFEIGRRSSHHLYLGGADVSRDHAVIERVGERFRLRDVGSRAGTFVNGEPIAERILEHGDRIHIGRANGADLTFYVDDAPSLSSASQVVARRELHQIATLLDALRALGSGHVLDEVLALVLDSALAVTGAERGFIMLAGEDGRLEFTLGRGQKQARLPGHTFSTSRKIPEEVFATGQPRVVADLLDADLADGHSGTIALGIRHVLCVPLNLVRYMDQPAPDEAPRRIGVLYLDGQDKGTLLSATTRIALETLAGEAALAIENARLYRQASEKARLDQQMRIGAEIQRALLPSATHVTDRFELAGATSSCLAIGGDFFDYLDLPSGSFGLVLGDVSGKGLPAALLNAMLQGIFATEASLGHPPSDALARLNQMMIRKAVLGRYATLFYGVLSPEGVLTYTNAGHNPAILIGRNGVSRLSRGGTIVGVFPDAVYEQAAVTLEPGDLLVVYSDGVTEAFDQQSEEFGEERLLACLVAGHDLPPDELVASVMTTVKAFVGAAPQSDDITVLALRYRGR